MLSHEAYYWRHRYRTCGVPASIQPVVLMKYPRSLSIQKSVHRSTILIIGSQPPVGSAQDCSNILWENVELLDNSIESKSISHELLRSSNGCKIAMAHAALCVLYQGDRRYINTWVPCRILLAPSCSPSGLCSSSLLSPLASFNRRMAPRKALEPRIWFC